MIPRPIFVVITVVWATACLALPQPPPRALTHVSGSITYYSGTVYLSAHEDTLKLKALGFRHFRFDSRAVNSLKYTAEWPQTAVSAPSPDYLNGLDYDVAADVQPDDNTATADTMDIDSISLARPPRHHANMGMDSATAHRFLAQLDVRVRALNRLDHPRPDTLIGDRKFTHGVVLMSSLTDTVGLIPLRFFGFEPGGMVVDSSDGEPVQYPSCHCYWPSDISVVDLPDGIHSIQSDRVRLGSGVVSIKPKTPAK
ncbi:MAG TPA: hypothetical protein VGL38_07155 [bacterium]|jgi:hypothetical protein